MAEKAGKTEKGALALQLAYDLVVQAFPLEDVTHERNEAGYTEVQRARGAFWGNASDEKATTARLQEMANLIGDLSRRME